MAIKKLNDGRYEVDIRPNGKNGKRLRRIFNRKLEAINFEKYVIINAKKFSGDVEYEGKVRFAYYHEKDHLLTSMEIALRHYHRTVFKLTSLISISQ